MYNNAQRRIETGANAAPNNVRRIVSPYTAQEWKQLKGWKEETGVVQSAMLHKLKHGPTPPRMWQYMRLRKGFHSVIFRDQLEVQRWGLELSSYDFTSIDDASKYKNPELWKLMEERETRFLGEIHRGHYTFFAEIALPGGRVCMPAIRWKGGINKAKSLFITLNREYKEID
jgi:hypothetical protein